MTPAVAPVFGPRRIAAWSLAWSLALTASEASILSGIDSLGARELFLWLMLRWMMPLWWLYGCVLLWVVQRAERRAGVPGMLGALVLVSVANATLQPVFGWQIDPIRWALLGGSTANLQALVPKQDPYAWISLALYQLWVGLVYGGLLVLAYAFVSRRERMQQLLHRGALARARTGMLLSAERLQAQQSQIDPWLLLTVMKDIASRYASDVRAGDRLLAALVEFLQCAMRGLRQRDSTLQAELALARAYLRLQSERGACAEWSIDDAAGSHPSATAFPGLLMLPLLALGDPRGPIRIDVRGQSEALQLSLSGLRHPPGIDLQQRIRHCLTALQADILLITTTCQGEHHVFRRNG